MRDRGALRPALLLVPLLVFTGCGDGDASRSSRPSDSSADARNQILVGGEENLAVFLTPLSSERRSAAWQSERLSKLIGDGRARSFFLLRIANLGAPGEEVQLTSLGLSMAVGGAQVEWDDLQDVLQRRGVNTSSLAYRALSTYDGRVLRGGETLDAVVAFPGVRSLAASVSARLWVAGRALALEPKAISNDELRGLLEHPTRDLILASLPSQEDTESRPGNRRPETDPAEER